MADLTEISVHVPTDRVAEFYAMFAAWNESPQNAVLIAREVRAAPAAKPWGNKDADLAKTVLSELPEGTDAGDVLRVLIENRDERLHWDEVWPNTAIAATRRAVAQAVADIASVCAKHDRQLPIDILDTGDGPTYSLKPELIDVFTPPTQANG